jgi:Domain of unknown function (DUF4954)
MNIIKKNPVSSLGYGFIKPEFIPKGKDEYHLRNYQNRNGILYRKLSAYEMEVLVRNSNTSDDWGNILVSDAFNPELVKNCTFYGLNRIGKLEPYYLEFHNLRMPVGLYNSTIISCDFGDNVVVDNVNFLSHYVIGSDVMIVNVNELATTGHAKFGNGVLKQGEDEKGRIWMELCNENAGRSVIPFNGMLPGDAHLWTRFRDDKVLLEKFKEFTEQKFDKQHGYYGKIGDRTVIKNCKIIKDVWIGSDAYLKGANKIKNVTINSNADAKSQVGEGCEIVNGIIGEGCRIFYGVKAVRFIMASHSQLKYGARLINSYLGNNATISCCEVLNSLIFPAHEQHHNNSFLCAALIMGQSNIAAGVTIGSNHNSRSPDGELIAGRGFWPGLCVSLKHNSIFASFTIIAKGDFPAELHIPLPFSLVSHDVAGDSILVMPGYWFLYNMYALARNAWKYVDRDRRTDKTQHIEYDYLAPDSINEIFDALQSFSLFTGKAWLRKEKPGKRISEEEAIRIGHELLEHKDPVVDELEILAEGYENSKRKIKLLKVSVAYHLFKELIHYYGITELVQWMETEKVKDFESLRSRFPAKPQRTNWMNTGGQLILTEAIHTLKASIHSGKIKSWDQVHLFYQKQGDTYQRDRLDHALHSLLEISGTTRRQLTPEMIQSFLNNAISTREWMTKGIHDSRAKDYTNPFRKMVYETNKEMNAVLGSLEENSFILQETAALESFKRKLKRISKRITTV